MTAHLHQELSKPSSEQLLNILNVGVGREIDLQSLIKLNSHNINNYLLRHVKKKHIHCQYVAASLWDLFW